MRQIIIYILLWCVNCIAIGHDDIVTRASVTPLNPWVGQRVILHIEVLGKDKWSQIKKFGHFDISGAFLMQTDSQGIRLQENIKGASYTGQRYEFSIYPQRVGRVTIPSVAVEVISKTWGRKSNNVITTVLIPKTVFTTKLPPGGQRIYGLISTTHFSAIQTYTPESQSLKIGDAIKRVVTISASDISAMAFTPLPESIVSGVGIYMGEPTVLDKNNRGELIGTRIEVITYVFENDGKKHLPDIILHWWDIKNNVLKKIKLPGLSIDIKGAAIPKGDTMAHRSLERNTPQFGYILAIVFFVGFIMYYRRRTLTMFKVWQQVRKASESTYFKKVINHLNDKDADLAYLGLMRWLDTVNNTNIPARLDLFLKKYGDADTKQIILDLSIGVKRPHNTMNYLDVKNALVSARLKWQKARHNCVKANTVLPELDGHDH